MSQPFPDLSIIVSPNNPVIKSPFVPYQLEFYQTKYSLMDIDRYTSFVKNAVSRFRASRAYKNYKFLEDYDKKNVFDIEEYIKRKGKVKLNRNTVITRL